MYASISGVLLIFCAEWWQVITWEHLCLHTCFYLYCGPIPALLGLLTWLHLHTGVVSNNKCKCLQIQLQKLIGIIVCLSVYNHGTDTAPDNKSEYFKWLILNVLDVLLYSPGYTSKWGKSGKRRCAEFLQFKLVPVSSYLWIN